jgi:hypothetical protein
LNEVGRVADEATTQAVNDLAETQCHG